MNPRSETLETGADVRQAVARALELFPPDKLFLNPDCGFGTFSNRPVNSAAVALAKMASIAEAAGQLRAEYGTGTQ